MSTELQLIHNKIFELRGQRVMLDFHLAELYGVETKNLKRSVRRNIKRFEGDDFMFELTREELEILRCNFGTSSQHGGTRHLPFAFTEMGVAMLSSILNSAIAIEINRSIMRTFVAMRHIVLAPAIPNESLEQRVAQLEELMNDILTDQNDINEDTRMQIELINESLAAMQQKNSKPRPRIGFDIRK